MVSFFLQVPVHQRSASTPSDKKKRHVLFRSEVALEVGRVGARGLRLGDLDVQDLHLASELEHLVRDLAVLERVRGRARRGGDGGVEERRLRVLGGLAHRVHVRRDGGVERGEVDAGEGVDEDGVRLGLRVARGAVGDLEGGVAEGRRGVKVVSMSY